MGVSDLNKICDYFIFVEEGVNLFVYLIELKKGTESARKQLEAAECFVKFLICSIDRLDEDFQIGIDELNIRKIRISESVSKKQKLQKEIIKNEHDIFDHKHPKDFRIIEYLLI